MIQSILFATLIAHFSSASGAYQTSYSPGNRTAPYNQRNQKPLTTPYTQPHYPKAIEKDSDRWISKPGYKSPTVVKGGSTSNTASKDGSSKAHVAREANPKYQAIKNAGNKHRKPSKKSAKYNQQPASRKTKVSKKNSKHRARTSQKNPTLDSEADQLLRKPGKLTTEECKALQTVCTLIDDFIGCNGDGCKSNNSVCAPEFAKKCPTPKKSS